MPDPVVELVGWTVLSGQQSVLTSPGAVERIEDASGDTILNAKAGARVSLTCDSDLYVGYGRCLDRGPLVSEYDPRGVAIRLLRRHVRGRLVGCARQTVGALTLGHSNSLGKRTTFLHDSGSVARTPSKR